jgi:hypothetical protein
MWSMSHRLEATRWTDVARAIALTQERRLLAAITLTPRRQIPQQESVGSACGRA